MKNVTFTTADCNFSVKYTTNELPLQVAVIHPASVEKLSPGIKNIDITVLESGPV